VRRGEGHFGLVSRSRPFRLRNDRFNTELRNGPSEGGTARNFCDYSLPWVFTILGMSDDTYGETGGRNSRYGADGVDFSQHNLARGD
jgi:hypothetical protein